jgi:1-acyl-sn-glycerol-3-phosphate acyltransferase
VPHLRAALRLTALALAVLILTVTWLAPLALRPFSPRASARLRARQMRTWARASLRILGIRVTITNPPPPRPFILVSNHLSYLDVPVLWSAVECSFLAKAEVARWPVLGPLTRAAGTLYVERGQRSAVAPALAALRARLALGESIALFPEGTSSPGAAILPFRSSLFAAAAAAGNRVWPAAISYDGVDPAAPPHLCVAWWGDMTFPDHFWRLLGLRGIHARVVFGPEPVTAADRKALAAAAHAACTRLFTPTQPAAPAAPHSPAAPAA